jgi:hypothetical protein
MIKQRLRNFYPQLRRLRAVFCAGFIGLQVLVMPHAITDANAHRPA